MFIKRINFFRPKLIQFVSNQINEFQSKLTPLVKIFFLFARRDYASFVKKDTYTNINIFYLLVKCVYLVFTILFHASIPSSIEFIVSCWCTFEILIVRKIYMDRAYSSTNQILVNAGAVVTCWVQQEDPSPSALIFQD